MSEIFGAVPPFLSAMRALPHWVLIGLALAGYAVIFIWRDNLDEKSGDQDENGRIAEWVDDCRWRGDAQAVFAG